MQDVIYYSQFGAVGDGITDDYNAICDAHRYANEHKLPVKAGIGERYYIGQSEKVAEIKTNTDWTGAEFIIDDSAIYPGMVNNVVFMVSPTEDITPPEIKSLKKGQKHLGFAPGRDMIITVEDHGRMRYKRYGINQNDGCPQTDTFVVKADGTILNDIIWDFDNISSIEAKPIEDELVIRGGVFTTVANRAEPAYCYYYRNIKITRSNVVLENLAHTIVGEGEKGCPYAGFITIASAAYVTLRNVKLYPHKTYYTAVPNGRVSMGSYEINAASSAFVRLEHVTQEHLMDTTKWGLMCTNFCKDFFLDGCSVSRFDAHMGVTNCTILNSTLGFWCLNAIGHGTLLIDGCELNGGAVVNLRPDYGAFWDGKIIIKNSVWYPHHITPTIINSSNNGLHEFGYDCMMPHSVTIENLRIADTNVGEGYHGARIFNDFDNHPEIADKLSPYKPTERLTVRNIICDSGIPCKIMAERERFPDITCDIDTGSTVAL